MLTGLPQGLTTHDPILCKPKSYFDPETKFYFPAFEHGIYFKDKSIVVENIEIPDPRKPGAFIAYRNALEIQFPIEFSILKSGIDFITYGVEGEIEVTYTHPDTGKFKAQYTIMNDKWLTFSYNYLVTLHSVIVEPNKEITYKAGQQLLTSNYIFSDISDKIQLIPPPESFAKFTISQNTITFTIKKGTKPYPLSFDPTIYIGAMNTNAYTSTGVFGIQCIRLSAANGGRIYVGYMTSTLQYTAAYSDDLGKTWTTENIAATVSPGYRDLTLCVDSNDKIYAVMGWQDGGFGFWGLSYTSKAFGGAWAAAAEIVSHHGGNAIMHPAAAVGPNGVLQVTYWNWDAVPNRDPYYTNPSLHAWPLANGASGLKINDTDPAYNACPNPLFVDKSSNDAIIVYQENRGRYVSTKMYDYSATSLSARFDIDTTGTTDYDMRTYSVCCATQTSSDTFYAAYTCARSTPGGYNIKIAKVGGMPAIPSATRYTITASSSLQYWYSQITIDADSYYHCHYMGNQVGTWSIFHCQMTGSSWTGAQHGLLMVGGDLEMPCPAVSYNWANQMPYNNYAFFYVDIAHAVAMWKDFRELSAKPFKRFSSSRERHIGFNDNFGGFSAAL